MPGCRAVLPWWASDAWSFKSRFARALCWVVAILLLFGTAPLMLAIYAPK